MPENRIRFGTVGRAHGIKGAVRVNFENPDSDFFAPGVHVHIEKHGDFEVEKILGGGRIHFVGVKDRNQAEALRGGVIFVDRDELPELDDDEYYFVDLIGADVMLESGDVLGTIQKFWTNNAQDIADVKMASGRVVAMPFVSNILVDVQPDEKRVVVNPPEGLFDDEEDS